MRTEWEIKNDLEKLLEIGRADNDMPKKPYLREFVCMYTALKWIVGEDIDSPTEYFEFIVNQFKDNQK